MGRVRRFFVSPTYRRNGVGSQLLAEIITLQKNIMIALSFLKIVKEQSVFTYRKDLAKQSITHILLI
ncbi:GNAT family N-acetyltransferase [Alteribacillus sp. JSM 102045]|uniref:GNAT family N-acetyltransferase n=1 Tax=Alteribacillus sp. JSM 102045 TaxID=1562101 RepID=UPI0035BFBF5C